jgi:hypothetical protein
VTHDYDKRHIFRRSKSWRAASADHSGFAKALKGAETTVTIDVTPEVSDDMKQQVITDIVQTKNYVELLSLIKKRNNEVEGEVAAYAMLQVSGLRLHTVLPPIAIKYVKITLKRV